MCTSWRTQTEFVQVLCKDCAGKSIFSANHILIIAYGQIALLLASMNLVWQVSAVCIRRRKFLWALCDRQSKNAISLKKSQTTTADLSFMVPPPQAVYSMHLSTEV